MIEMLNWIFIDKNMYILSINDTTKENCTAFHRGLTIHWVW